MLFRHNDTLTTVFLFSLTSIFRYRGETYAMQLDAHVTFIQDWDLLMISQFFETKNDMAVLSTYLTDVQVRYPRKLHKYISALNFQNSHLLVVMKSSRAMLCTVTACARGLFFCFNPNLTYL